MAADALADAIVRNGAARNLLIEFFGPCVV